MSQAVDELLSRFLWSPDEPAGEFLAQAPLALPARPPEQDRASEEFLAFSLSGELFAVPVAAVREVMKVPAVTSIPHAPPNVLGLINLRGEMLPVYDVRPRLRLELAPTHWPLPSTELRSLRVVLLRAPGGDAGILAEGVQGVVRLPMDALEAPPAAPLPMACVAGLGRRGEELYILLDIEAALG